ncbi:MAG: 3-hydroxyacyl-ACP dehydratase [Niabella sp.]
MLNNSLYTITSFEQEEGKVEARIHINAEHKIFEGHFPGQPVLPGVCMLQIMKELMEKSLSKNLFMHEASQCKFLSMVDPRQTADLMATLQYTQAADGIIALNGVLKDEQTIFLKLVCSYTVS